MEGKRRKRILQGGPALGVIAGLIVLVHSVSEGQGTTEYKPATWNFPGARSAALGNAASSDPYDIEGMYQNPAVLSFLRNPSGVLDYRHDWSNRVSQENTAVPILAGHKTSFGVGIGVENSGKLTRNEALSFTQLDIDAACAFRFPGAESDVSLGILCEFRAGRDDSLSHTAAQFSVGLLYAPAAGPSYSIVYRGLGKTIAYSSASGAGGNSTRGRLEESPRSLEIGSTMRFPDLYRTPLLTFSVAGERDFISRIFRLKGGMEMTFFKMLNLRMGYAKAETAQLSCGAGFSIALFSLDYAIMPSVQSGQFNEVTLKVAI